MRIRWKFFCTAYVAALLATGLMGSFLVFNTTGVLRSTRIGQVSAAENYAVGSFLSLADITPGRITGRARTTAEQQIRQVLDDCISGVTIRDLDEAAPEYAALEANEGVSAFSRRGECLLLETVCRVQVGEDAYLIGVQSDFTDIEARCRQLWRFYCAAVLLLALASGLVLYVLSRRLTAPLNRLTDAAQEIAGGRYGKTVAIRSHDREIVQLSDSFNAMSLTVKQTVEELQAESERRMRFVSDFTHELKTPMTAIIGYSQLLTGYELDTAEARQAAEAIGSEGQRLEELSRRLLELVIYCREEIQLEPVCLSALQERLEATLRVPAEKYGVHLSVCLPAVWIEADPALLLSLFYNLADNAFKASAPGGEVAIGAQAAESVTVLVQDHGRGIAPESIAHLTEPFFREDKARSRALGGAGLGLALCREIARIHGTVLHFESIQGQGTTVSFTLKKAAEVTEECDG